MYASHIPLHWFPPVQPAPHWTPISETTPTDHSHTCSSARGRVGGSRGHYPNSVGLGSTSCQRLMFSRCGETITVSQVSHPEYTWRGVTYPGRPWVGHLTPGPRARRASLDRSLIFFLLPYSPILSIFYHLILRFLISSHWDS